MPQPQDQKAFTGALDHTDLRLLNFVQQNDGLTAKELAVVIPLSPSALARRLRKLRREGYITRSIALVAPALIRGHVRAILQVQLVQQVEPSGTEGLRQCLISSPEVQMCYEVAGLFDLIALVVCRHVEALTEFATNTLELNPIVQRYETVIIKRQLKFAPAVQLEMRDLSLAD